jgi:hypothetical protein
VLQELRHEGHGDATGSLQPEAGPRPRHGGHEAMPRRLRARPMRQRPDRQARCFSETGQRCPGVHPGEHHVTSLTPDRQGEPRHLDCAGRLDASPATGWTRRVAHGRAPGDGRPGFFIGRTWSRSNRSPPIQTAKPPPKPGVFVIAGDGQISEISDISGFLLHSRWLDLLRPPAVGSCLFPLLFYPYLIFIRIAGVIVRGGDSSDTQWKTTDITDFTDPNRRWRPGAAFHQHQGRG